jgi:hypothetical protein
LEHFFKYYFSAINSGQKKNIICLKEEKCEHKSPAGAEHSAQPELPVEVEQGRPDHLDHQTAEHLREKSDFKNDPKLSEK